MEKTVELLLSMQDTSPPPPVSTCPSVDDSLVNVPLAASIPPHLLPLFSLPTIDVHAFDALTLRRGEEQEEEAKAEAESAAGFRANPKTISMRMPLLQKCCRTSSFWKSSEATQITRSSLMASVRVNRVFPPAWHPSFDGISWWKVN